MLEFTFDRRSQRYRYRDSGRYVSEESVKNLTRAAIDQVSSELQTIGNLLVDGKINVSAWEDQTATAIKKLNIWQYALGKGGFKQLGTRDAQVVSDRLRKEYRYLRGFSEDLLAGKLTEGQFRSRLNLYLENSTLAYELGRRESHRDAGFKWEKRIRNALESCPECIGYEAFGWQQFGSLPLPGQDCTCKANCKCSLQYSMEKPEDSLLLRRSGYIGKNTVTTMSRIHSAYQTTSDPEVPQVTTPEVGSFVMVEDDICKVLEIITDGTIAVEDEEEGESELEASESNPVLKLQEYVVNPSNWNWEPSDEICYCYASGCKPISNPPGADSAHRLIVHPSDFAKVAIDESMPVVGHPTEAMLAKINRYVPPGMPDLTADELLVIPIVVADNLISRSSCKWSVDCLRDMPKYLEGVPMTLNHDWETVELAWGRCFDSYCMKADAASLDDGTVSKLCDRNGNNLFNRNILQQEGYWRAYALAYVPVNSPVVESLRYAQSGEVSSGGFNYLDILCPYCGTSAIDPDGDCRHWLPDPWGFSSWRTNENVMPYYIRDGLCDMMEVSLVLTPNLPMAGVVRRG